MQTHLHCGWGCPGNLITDEEVAKILNSRKKDPDTGIGLRFEPFTEGEAEASWGTVVVRDFGPAGLRGKALTAAHVHELLSSHATISAECRHDMAVVLASVGLERLVNEISLMLFHANY